MKILIMVHSLTGGGAERVAALWATGFVERGYEVGMVLNCSENTPITYKVPDTIKIYRLHSWLANMTHGNFNSHCGGFRLLLRMASSSIRKGLSTRCHHWRIATMGRMGQKSSARNGHSHREHRT